MLSAMQNAAAIVGTESLHLGPPQQGFNGKVELAVSGASGNTDKSEFAADTRLEWAYGQHTSFVVGSYSRGEVSDVVNTEKSFLHLRQVFQQTPFLAWEGFAQGERDEFARLSARRLIGGGSRLTLLEQSPDRAMFFGLGAMLVGETTTEQVGTTDAGSERLWRANTYLVLKYRIQETVTLINSIYYQPALRGGSDYRLLDTLTLQVKLADRLALQLSLNVTHDSRPPETIENTDVVYRTGLSWSF